MRKILKALGDRVRGLLKGQRGFTLIELLVAVGIVAILAGIAVPMVTRFISTAEDRAQTAEWTNVQTAVDAMMAEKLLPDLTGCTKPVGAENDMTLFPCSEDGLHLYPNGIEAAYTPYLRTDNGVDGEGEGFTECDYSVVDDGTISQTCP